MPDIAGFFILILVELYKVTGNLGISIIALTFIIRSILVPITLPSMKSQQKIKEMQPELKALKKKHTDKKVLQQKQLELYQKYNINPLAGCIPQLAQLGVLIFLYHALTSFISNTTVQGIEIKHRILLDGFKSSRSKVYFASFSSINSICFISNVGPRS
jgi:YidC/Oxa1 family membrane protein insertase